MVMHPVKSKKPHQCVLYHYSIKTACDPLLLLKQMPLTRPYALNGPTLVTSHIVSKLVNRRETGLVRFDCLTPHACFRICDHNYCCYLCFHKNFRDGSNLSNKKDQPRSSCACSRSCLFDRFQGSYRSGKLEIGLNLWKTWKPHGKLFCSRIMEFFPYFQKGSIDYHWFSLDFV